MDGMNIALVVYDWQAILYHSDPIKVYGQMTNNTPQNLFRRFYCFDFRTFRFCCNDASVLKTQGRKTTHTFITIIHLNAKGI